MACYYYKNREYKNQQKNLDEEPMSINLSNTINLSILRYRTQSISY